TKSGKKLFARLGQVEKELAARHKRTDESRQARDSKQGPKVHRKMAVANRDLNKKRSELKARIRKESGKIRRSDRKVRAMVTRLTKSKRELDELLRKSSVSKLRKISESKRKNFLATQHRTLQNDAELTRLRMQIDDTSTQLRQARRRIHQARKQNAEEFLLHGESADPDPEPELTDIQSASVPSMKRTCLATRLQI
ncbi:hypothetical protein ACFL2H_10970, partial [Planctomycetota bacterium]